MSKSKRGLKGGIDLQSVQVSAPGSAAAAVHDDLPPMPERDVLDRQLQDVMVRRLRMHDTNTNRNPIVGRKRKRWCG
jgi:hypothetical protein